MHTVHKPFTNKPFTMPQDVVHDVRLTRVHVDDIKTFKLNSKVCASVPGASKKLGE